MDCKFAVKVSQLIDGELAAEEREAVKTHIAGCKYCRQMEIDFLFFRQQINEPVSENYLFNSSVQSAQRNLKKVSFWQRRIFLPAPVFVLSVFVLIAFGIWTISVNLNRKNDNSVVVESMAKKRIENQSKQNPAGNEISLSRFDRGGRAEIYTVRQQSSTEGKKPESVNQ